MQDATTVILMHVDCGYGAFCKRSPDVLYCKTELSGPYAELYNQCWVDQGMTLAKADSVYEAFCALPGRVMLDTCILNLLQDQGGFIFEGEMDEGQAEGDMDIQLRALRNLFTVNERASFQLVISPLVVAEVANVQDFAERERRVRWVLDVLDHWLIMLDEIQDRTSHGGSVRTRFKLTPALQAFESRLIETPDFRRDPFDRLLLVQYQMADCDAFMTTDNNTIWRHRRDLTNEGVRVLRPSEFWTAVQPFATLWA